MGERAEGEVFRVRWLVPAVRAIFAEVGDVTALEPLEVVFHVDDEDITLELVDGRVEARLGGSGAAHVAVTCDPQAAVGILTGRVALADAAATVSGEDEAVARFHDLVSRVEAGG